MLFCLGDFYLTFFIWVIIRESLFFLGFRYSTNNYERLLLLLLIIDVVMLLSLPLLLGMTGGVC